jgi:hypothetical protein
MMTILRRVTGVVPVQILRPAAPVRDDADGAGPLTVPAASPDLPSVPPSHLPGVCYHHAHIEHGGQRYGVLVLNDRDASLLRCGHVNRDGR